MSPSCTSAARSFGSRAIRARSSVSCCITGPGGPAALPPPVDAPGSAFALPCVGPVPVCGTVNVPGGSVASGAGVAAMRASPCWAGVPLGPNAEPVVPKPIRRNHPRIPRNATAKTTRIGIAIRAGKPTRVSWRMMSRAPRRRRAPAAVRAVQLDAFPRRDTDLPDRVQRAVLQQRRPRHVQAAADRALTETPGGQGGRVARDAAARDNPRLAARARQESRPYRHVQEEDARARLALDLSRPRHSGAAERVDETLHHPLRKMHDGAAAQTQAVAQRGLRPLPQAARGVRGRRDAAGRTRARGVEGCTDGEKTLSAGVRFPPAPARFACRTGDGVIESFPVSGLSHHRTSTVSQDTVLAAFRAPR